MKPFLIAFLIFIPSLCHADHLVRITAEDVVERLRRDGVLVCFERTRNQKEDAITLKAQIRAIQNIPEAERTHRESERLDWRLQSRKEGMPDYMIVNWRQKEFDFDYPDTPANPEEILSALTKADADYTWEQKGNRYLVYPSQKSFKAESINNIYNSLGCFGLMT
jgi:hypothetical protein